MSENFILSNYKKVSDDVFSTCNLYNRNPADVKLIVVTKGHSSKKIESVITAGARYLGENYPEETIEKKNFLTNLPEDLEWHMIGHLQSRKSLMVIDNFKIMHSLDSVKLAERLNRQLWNQDKNLEVLLQFNVGGEVSKYGWDASEERNWDSLILEVEKILGCKNLKVRGLMTMPPYLENEKDARMNFSKLRRLGEFFSKKISNLRIDEYSMGTSHDFKMAIAEGSTMIRIGTAILGQRDK